VIEITQHDAVTQFKMGRELDGRVLYWVSAYLVDGLLIDTGCRHTAEELVIALEGRQVRDAICTHYHEDHIGGNKLLREQLSIKVWAHPRTAPLVFKAPALYPYQELVWGYPDPAELLPLPGELFETENCRFQVVEAPGHSEDHVVLIEPERGWCFSGDLYVSERIKVLRPEEEAGAIMRSIKKLLALPYELTLFTSIGKIVPEGRAALRACLDYLQGLGREVKQLQQQGLTVSEIVERVFGGESALADLTNGQFASENLIRSLLNADFG
jgi:glyoxylase-like metal-dependent hydrolase (beta-lactamase superfamily II)